jgi:unsaturated rhamnogalacturonyl hydrolase
MVFRIFVAHCALSLLVAAATPYSVRMADSLITRNTSLGLDDSGDPKMSYEHGVVERALEMVYNATGNYKYYAYQKWGVDNIIDSSGRLMDYNLTEYTLDDMRLGPEFLYLWQKTGEAKYKNAADTLRRQLDTHPRNSDSRYPYHSSNSDADVVHRWVLAPHCVPEPNVARRSIHDAVGHRQSRLSIVLIEIHNSPFYAEHTALFSPTNTTAWSDILRQFTDLQLYALNHTSGLLDHGYDASHVAVWADPITGASPHVWDRALGWYTMALLDVLDYFPPSHVGYEIILGYFQALMPAVVNATDPETGGWWLVMDQPGREKNYIESSGTAIFVYSLLKGVRMGYLSTAGGFVEIAERAYQHMVDVFVVEKDDGTLDWEGTVEVGSLKGTGDYDVSSPIGLLKFGLIASIVLCLCAAEDE